MVAPGDDNNPPCTLNIKETTKKFFYIRYHGNIVHNISHEMFFMFHSFFNKRRKLVYAEVAREIEKYKNDNLAYLFTDEMNQSIVFDQWASIFSNLKFGLSKLRAHIYEVREEYTSVVIIHHKKNNAFFVVSFTVGRHKKSLPWDVHHHVSKYPISGETPAHRNKAALDVIGGHNLSAHISASFM